MNSGFSPGEDKQAKLRVCVNRSEQMYNGMMASNGKQQQKAHQHTNENTIITNTRTQITRNLQYS